MPVALCGRRQLPVELDAKERMEVYNAIKKTRTRREKKRARRFMLQKWKDNHSCKT